MDHYPDLQQRFVGGISLNFAVHSKRCGAEAVSLVSRIGEDHGAEILLRLTNEEVDASHVSMHPGATAQQEITVAASGERIFPPGGYHPGVLENFHLAEEDLRFIQQHNLLASAMFRQVEPLFRQVMENSSFEGWRVADFLDLSDYNQDIQVMEEFCERLTIAFVSGNPELVERLRPLSRKSRSLIVITLGAGGSVALERGEPTFQASTGMDVVDSTGCGDAFQAAFTVSYWNDRNVHRALQCGAQHAAKVLQHYGAIG